MDGNFVPPSGWFGVAQRMSLSPDTAKRPMLSCRTPASCRAFFLSPTEFAFRPVSTTCPPGAVWDLGRKHRTEPMPPEPDGLMADIYPSLVQHVLDVPERERETDVEYHRKADDLRARLEVLKRPSLVITGRYSPPSACSIGHFGRDSAFCRTLRRRELFGRNCHPSRLR